MAAGRQPTYKSGFTLIEMSTSLLVMSVIIGTGFAVATKMGNDEKITSTRERLDQIEAALYQYRTNYNRLPCPADGTLTPDSANFGIEAANNNNYPNSCTGGTPAANFSAAEHASKTGNPATQVVGGVVPVTTLGLPKSYAYDGYGNKISYHVDSQATENAAFSHYGMAHGKCFNILIDDEKTWSANSDRNYFTFHAVYALVSHGKDGHGAFTKGGSRQNTAVTNTYTIGNANYDASGAATDYDNLFFVLPATEDPATPKNTFDDMVRYKTREQLRTKQDGPAHYFPDLVVSASNTPSNLFSIDFYFRCRDRFIREQEEMIFLENRRADKVVISPDNKYLLAPVTNDRHFIVWMYDGIKTTRIPNGNFSDYEPGAQATSAGWSKDGEFFFVSAFDDVGSLPDNRVSVYETTGTNVFSRKDAAIDNDDSEFSAGSLNVSLSPDGNEMSLVYNGSGTIVPKLYERNSDNTFTTVDNAFDPLPPDTTYNWPVWSPDGTYMLFVEYDEEVMHLYRNDGYHHYSKAPAPTPALTATAKIWNAAFSPDAKFLVVVEKSNKFHIYKRTIGDQYEKISPHPADLPLMARSVAFSPDGKYLSIGMVRAGAGDAVLAIYKIDGSTFTLLSSPDGPQSYPDASIIDLQWKHLMPWEKGS